MRKFVLFAKLWLLSYALIDRCVEVRHARESCDREAVEQVSGTPFILKAVVRMVCDW